MLRSVLMIMNTALFGGLLPVFAAAHYVHIVIWSVKWRNKPQLLQPRYRGRRLAIKKKGRGREIVSFYSIETADVVELRTHLRLYIGLYSLFDMGAKGTFLLIPPLLFKCLWRMNENKRNIRRWTRCTKRQKVTFLLFLPLLNFKDHEFNWPSFTLFFYLGNRSVTPSH